MATTGYRTAEDVRDSIEGLFLEHGNRRPWIYWMAMLLTAAALVALPLVKVETAVGAAGQIRPAVERLRVYPAVGGRIQELGVRDNQAVKLGDVLLVLDSADLDARVAQNRTEWTENEQALADLTLLLAKREGLEHTGGEGEQSSDLAWGRVPVVSASYLRQQSVLESDVLRLSLQLENAQRELQRFTALHERGLVTEREFTEKQFGVRRIAREIDLLVQQALSRWQSDRVERNLRAATLRSEFEQLQQRRTLYTVQAPIDGVAIGFTGLQPGLFVPAEQPLGEITPSGDLQADVYLKPRDVGFVHIDQPVQLQIDAFPYNEWGTVQGRVLSVSQDFVQVGQQIAFKAVVGLESAQLQSAAGATVNLRRGMTAQARFILQRRSLFSLLFQKSTEVFDPRTGSGEDRSLAGVLPGGLVSAVIPFHWIFLSPTDA